MSEKEKMDRGEIAEEASVETGGGKAASRQKETDKPKKAKTEKSKKPSVGQRLSRFLREMKAELKKVSWPPRSDTMRNTGVVIVCVLVVAVIVWIFDGIASSVVNALLTLFGH